MYLNVFEYIWMYLNVFECIWMYFECILYVFEYILIEYILMYLKYECI